MSTLTFDIPNEIKDQLEQLSLAQNLPVNDLVIESLRRYLAIESFKTLRAKTVPLAKEQGFLTDDDICSVVS